MEKAFTNPESSEAPVCSLRLQVEEVRQVGQRVSLDAVKHHAGQPGFCQPLLRLLQKASYPNLEKQYNRSKSIVSIIYQICWVVTCKIPANKVLKCGTHQYFLVLLPYGTRGKNFFSPVGVRADLHDAPGAALLTFLQLVVYDQLSRLQHRHKTMGYCKFLMTSPPQKRP